MSTSHDLTPANNDFGAVISIIENAKGRALKAVNAELINMYWEVGEYLSKLCAESSFGDKVIDEVADYISEANPTIKGFNRRGLYRMRQFYETYKDDEFVTPLVTQISWTKALRNQMTEILNELRRIENGANVDDELLAVIKTVAETYNGLQEK